MPRAALLVLTFTLGAAPAAPPAPEAKVAAPQEPARFALTEGQPVAIGHGVTVTLKSVMYAHLKDSKNDSLMQLTVARDGHSEEVTLERLEPGPPRYQAVLGLQLAIDYVDAYHQPSTGAILVLAGR